MEISEVRIKLVGNPNDRLKAFCTITFDDVFVVRDLKIVDGGNGLFVAMPSRRVLTPCGSCRHKNAARSRFCNGCGAQLPEDTGPVDVDAQGRLHRDIAHPINSEFRKIVQDRVLEAFAAECQPESFDEPDDVDERDDEALSEYDSLIADLRGGSSGSRDRGPAPRDRAPAPLDRAPAPHGREGGSRPPVDDRSRDRQHGPPREDRGRVEAGERQARRDRVEPGESTRRGPSRGPGAERVAASAEQDRDSASAEQDRDAANAGQDRVAASAGQGRDAAKAITPTPAPARPRTVAPPAPVDDGASGFGTGILSPGAPAARPPMTDAVRKPPEVRSDRSETPRDVQPPAAPPRNVEPPAPSRRDVAPPPPPRERAIREQVARTAPPEARNAPPKTAPPDSDDDAFGAGLL
jgi:stage V sporulation protein G